MPSLSFRNLSAVLFILFLPGYLFADHDAVLRELDASLTTLFLTTALAAFFFLLLLIFRTRSLGVLNLICGIAMIVVSSGKMNRYLLTDLGAQLYILSSFIQLTLSVIFGWVYQKRASGEAALTETSGTYVPVDKNRRVMTLSVVFIISFCMAIYNIILFYIQDETGFSFTGFDLVNSVLLLLGAVVPYLFSRNSRVGWVLGTAFLISLLFPSVFSQVSSLIISLKYPMADSFMFQLYYTVYSVCLGICVFLIVSPSVKITFNIQSKHLLIAIALGLVLGVFRVYLSTRAAEKFIQEKYNEQVDR